MSKLRDTSEIASLYCDDPSQDSPRMAKNEAYVKSVLSVWKSQVKASSMSCCETTEIMNDETLGSQLIYKRDDGEPLGGYMVIPSTLLGKHDSSKKKSFPAIVLIHTGAGPQDIFLRWKADSLAKEVMGGNGCVVLIADLLSDLKGWTWCDREKYNIERTKILEEKKEESDGGSLGRWKLRALLDSTLNVLRNMEQVDEERIAVLGFCFGGQSIAELGRMKCDGVVGLVSYHGVFDGLSEPRSSELQENEWKQETRSCVSNQKQAPRALIFNGNDDPFVKPEDIELVSGILRNSGFSFEVIGFDGVCHGFTNPFQDYNPDPRFSYNEKAAKDTWDSTIRFLNDVFTK